MLIMDTPPAPLQETPVVLAQAAFPYETKLPDYLLKTCDEVLVSGAATPETNTIYPSGWLVNEISDREGNDISTEEFYKLSANVRVTEIQDTEHGELIRRITSVGSVSYEYRPEPGFTGNDQAIFMAEFKFKRYKIIADIIVSKTINEETTLCPEPQLIKVKKRASNPSIYDSGYKLAYVAATYGTSSNSFLHQIIACNRQERARKPTPRSDELKLELLQEQAFSTPPTCAHSGTCAAMRRFPSTRADTRNSAQHEKRARGAAS